MKSSATSKPPCRRPDLGGPFQRVSLLALLFGSLVWSAAAAKPNIVFILADDLGWRDVGCYGSTFHKTPNIERWPNAGMMFTQAYAANPLCSPTRASILTGQYPGAHRHHRAGLPRAGGEARSQPCGRAAPPDQRCLVADERHAARHRTTSRWPRRCKAAGYATGHFGKWHLGRGALQPAAAGLRRGRAALARARAGGQLRRAVEVPADAQVHRPARRAHRGPHGRGGGQVHPRQQGPAVLPQLLGVLGPRALRRQEVAGREIPRRPMDENCRSATRSTPRWSRASTTPWARWSDRWKRAELLDRTRSSSSSPTTAA